MKTIVLSFVISLTTFIAFSQDYTKLSLNYMQGKPEEAKKEIDDIWSSGKIKDKDKAEAYLWKFKVYSELHADSTLSTKYPDAGEEALQALEQYKSLDTSYKKLKEEGARGVGLIYNSSFNYGQINFRDQQWDSAFKYFARANEMGNFIMNNGMSTVTMAIDTVTVFLAGASAQNAKKFDDAANYYKQIADLKIGGDEYIDAYKYLTDYYMRQKDSANFNKYIVIAKELYPGSSDMWAQMEMQNMTQSTNLSDVIKNYYQEAAQGTLNEDKYINYAETFASPSKEQLDALDSLQEIELRRAAADAYGKAFATNPNGLYSFNSGVVNYNMFGTLDERYYNNRGEGSAQKAARTEIQNQQTTYADTAAYWLEQAYEALKAKTDRSKIETNSLNRTVDYLANLYLWKRDKSKGVDAKAYDMYDEKFKKYDAEHNKYVVSTPLNFSSVKIGMTKEEVKKLVGEPNNITSTTTASGKTELYFYDQANKVVNFDESGLVDYIKDSQ